MSEPDLDWLDDIYSPLGRRRLFRLPRIPRRQYPRRLVLWGARLGEIQFGSRDDWRTHIPVGADTITVESAAYFDVGTLFEIYPSRTDFRGRRVVVGIEGAVLGVRSL